jgi:hypothetical protein
MGRDDKKPAMFMRPGKTTTDKPGVTLADPRTRSSFIRLAEDNRRLHKVVSEIVDASGETYSDVLAGVMTVIDAARERDTLDESACDPERLALSDRVQARALRERISFAEALEREGVK